MGKEKRMDISLFLYFLTELEKKKAVVWVNEPFDGRGQEKVGPRATQAGL